MINRTFSQNQKILFQASHVNHDRNVAIFFNFWIIWIIGYIIRQHPLRKMYPYSEFFRSVFFRIRTEYGKILRISPYSLQMRENTDQNNSEYGHFFT